MKKSEGYIRYLITYPDLDSNDLSLNLLPKEMIFYFKEDKYMVETVAGMGLFRMGYIASSTSKVMDYYLKMVNLKYVSRFKGSNAQLLYQNFPAFKLLPSDTSATIAGQKCRAKKVAFLEKEVEDFHLFYFKEKGFTHPNWCTPFHEVDGFLMEYRLKNEGLLISFKASEINFEKLPEDQFNIPLDYEVVSNIRIAKQLEEALTGFNF